MNNLQVFTHKNIQVTDSRDVARMVEKQHSHLMRDVREYGDYLNQSKIGSVDFFIESTYIDSKGEERPNYLITRKGCEFIANKLTGKKGTLFTAAYINAFHALEQNVVNGKPLDDATRRMLAQAKYNNSRARISSVWLKLADASDSPTHKQICASYASKELAGTPILPLPTVDKTYSATEIGDMFGVSANRIGKLANQNGLKTDKYGITVMDKSRHSAKEMPTFRYNDRALAWFKNYFQNNPQ